MNNTIINNARGGIHLYSNCGEKVTTDPTYVPRIFDAEYNSITNNYIFENNESGAIEIGKRVDWNLEDWDCAKPIYQQLLSFKFYYGDILIRTDKNISENNQQTTIINSVVRLLASDPLINNIII